MGALKLPQKLAYSRANQHLCHRIGIRLNGVDMEDKGLAYDVAAGWVLVRGGDKKHGTVEPYWRTR